LGSQYDQFSQAELHFDGRIALCRLVELRLQPFGGGARRFSLAGVRRAEIQHLHLPQPFAKLIFDNHSAVPPMKRRHRANPASTQSAEMSTRH
jgi:hypothetical protein